MQKRITERTCKVMHDNASSEGTRKGWEARLERQNQINEDSPIIKN
jgi:hypothetical protein